MQYLHCYNFARVIIGSTAFALLLSFSMAARTQPTGGVEVNFPTQDATGVSLNLRGELWEPTEPAKGAVVIVHGSGGWSDYREGHYGRALSAAGYAALAIDTFGPRGINGTTGDQAQISSMQMTRDAFAARHFLLERGFSAEHLAVMGFSKGGAVALYAADRNFLPEETERFAAAIPFFQMIFFCQHYISIFVDVVIYIFNQLLHDLSLLVLTPHLFLCRVNFQVKRNRDNVSCCFRQYLMIRNAFLFLTLRGSFLLYIYYLNLL